MKINVLKNLFAADLLLVGSYGLLLPLFALFLTERLPDASIQAISASAALWLFSYAMFDWIFAAYLQHGNPTDRARGGLVAGSIFTALVPLFYIYAKDMTLIYAAQICLGVGLGMGKSSWSHIMRHITEEKHRRTVRKMRQFSNVMIMAAAAALGGLVAAQFGFDRLLWMMFLLGVSATGVSAFAVFAVKE